jgi:hypothetical protein
MTSSIARRDFMNGIAIAVAADLHSPPPVRDVIADFENEIRDELGRMLGIANSDSGWDAYTHVAIDQAHRAVLELAG